MEIPRPLAGKVLTMTALTLIALTLTAEANLAAAKAAEADLIVAEQSGAEGRTTRITARSSGHFLR
jgi:hypothetical protein